MKMSIDKNGNTILRVSQSEFILRHIQEIISSYIALYGGEPIIHNTKYIYFKIYHDLLNNKSKREV